MAEIKACLFDLDGVIVDTAKYHYLAWRRMCNQLGFELSHEENENLKGISRKESMEILLRKGGVSLSENEKQDLMQRKNEWYLEYVDAMRPDEILPGVQNFLELLRAANIKIALGSASKNALPILEKINLMPYFDAIIDGTKVTRGKPHPETFLLGAEAVGVAPQHAVVFEDAAAGVEAALSGNMYAVGVGEPGVLHRAHVVIEGFEGLGLEIFDQL